MCLTHLLQAVWSLVSDTPDTGSVLTCVWHPCYRLYADLCLTHLLQDVWWLGTESPVTGCMVTCVWPNCYRLYADLCLTQLLQAACRLVSNAPVADCMLICVWHTCYRLYGGCLMHLSQAVRWVVSGTLYGDFCLTHLLQAVCWFDTLPITITERGIQVWYLRPSRGCTAKSWHHVWTVWVLPCRMQW